MLEWWPYKTNYLNLMEYECDLNWLSLYDRILNSGKCFEICFLIYHRMDALVHFKSTLIKAFQIDETQKP